MADAIDTPVVKPRRGPSTRGQVFNCHLCDAVTIRTHSAHIHCAPCSKINKLEIRRRWIEANPEKRLASVRAYNDRNREEINEKFRTRLECPEVKASRRLIDLAYSAGPKQRIDQRMKTQIGLALKGGKSGRSWASLVGYSVEELMRHLERQFLKSMSWDNVGEWHVDHIRPRASFSYENEEDDNFRQCWALTNLRPLWSADNQSKGAKRLFLI